MRDVVNDHFPECDAANAPARRGARARVDAIVSTGGPIRYDALVQDERVHASLYTDPLIFADEMERIFHRGWVFVGHESEIPSAGDFVTRPLGEQPVIMTRTAAGEVAVLLNRCAHRGTLVCPVERGHARVFACPYHGWTYDVDGTPLWLTATARRSGSGYAGDVIRTTGPAFNAVPFDPQSVTRSPVGSMTVNFGDGNNATFAYTVTIGSPAFTVSRFKQLTRLIFRGQGTICR